jgi:prephenate dehydrogenase
LTDLKVAVLGVGLIGGSIGLAARRRVGAYVSGYDPDPERLARAVELGAIDEPVLAISDAVGDADAVFVAAPVSIATETARLALDAASGECVVSDVGSTKRQIAQELLDPRFVGGHPLAGAETAGVENAREDLFDGATWYLTPAILASSAAEADSSVTEAPAAAIERLRELIERLGARPVTIDPEDHDRLMANVSHLPHVFANVLVARAMRAVESDDVTVEEGRLGAGQSFRDATRVAGANTSIWTDIYMANRDLLAEAIEEAIEQLGEVRDALDSGDADALAAWNEGARVEREKLRRAGLAPGA